MLFFLPSANPINIGEPFLATTNTLGLSLSITHNPHVPSKTRVALETDSSNVLPSLRKTPI
jgi:hypothetical protein